MLNGYVRIVTTPMPLQVGDLAPDFSLFDGSGNEVTLSALRGKRVVLYFYPRDNTPGCTQEACGFRDIYPDLQRCNAVVFGISTDSAASHQAFAQKYDLPFPLLVDADATAAKAYESYGPKKFMGKEYVGVIRNTFVIAPDGTIAAIYRNVKPKNHPASLLADLLAEADG